MNLFEWLLRHKAEVEEREKERAEADAVVSDSGWDNQYPETDNDYDCDHDWNSGNDSGGDHQTTLGDFGF